MATFAKRARSWQAKVCRKGIRRTATFPTKIQAQEWASKTENEIISGHYGLGVRKTLAEAIDAYLKANEDRKGVKYEQTRLQAFKRDEAALCAKVLPALTIADFIAFRDARMAQVAPATVRREFSLLGGVFSYAVERQWLQSNPLRDVKKPQSPPARRRGVSQAEIDAMVKALGPDGVGRQIALCFLLGIETGMRQGEMLSLTWDQVDLKQRVVTLLKTKNGDSRQVPLTVMAVSIIRSLTCFADDAVSLPPEGKGLGGPLFTVASGSLDTLFRRARDAAALVCPSVATLHFHDSRSEAVTRLSKKLDVLELARVIGHRDMRSLLIYFSPQAADLAKKL